MLTPILDSNSPMPLYEQLYRHIRGEIEAGRLAAGERLPSKRTLAAHLKISVVTVEGAYNQLLAEGYLQSQPKRGFFVQAAEAAPPRVSPSPLPPTEEPARPTFRYNFSTSAVDTALFPFRTWGRLQKELLYASPELLLHGHRQGDEDLRRSLADYLHAYRGVVCNPDQIVVGAGVEYLLGLAAQLLRGRTAAVENPGYSRSRTILVNSGVPCRCVDIDGGGLSLEGLEDSGADLCYVTPSHHFPTGVTMPVGRRSQLLRWAAAKPGRYILEDDYDAEFRFDMRPLPSLQGMAGPDGPVVYLCTFSKSLAPSIRIACMVLPPELLARYRETFGSYANTVSRFEQQTLCRFLTGGYFTRHLARLRSAYKARSAHLIQELEVAFGRENIVLQGRHTGLHLLLTLRDGPGEAAMVASARALGIGLRGLSDYYMARRELCLENTVVLGYASLPDGEIHGVVERLRQAWGQEP